KNRGQINCSSRVKPALRLETSRTSGTWRPLIATATPASPLAQSENALAAFLNRDSPCGAGAIARVNRFSAAAAAEQKITSEPQRDLPGRSGGSRCGRYKLKN